MKLFGVVGCPISHSQSPLLFRQFFNSAGINAEYLRIAATDYRHLIEIVQEGTLKLEGINVTAPFKHDAYLLCHERSEESDMIEACNCVRFENNRMKGANTDVLALKKLISRIYKQKKTKFGILILGAGKAAEAAIAAGLLSDCALNVDVWNRGEEKLNSLKIRFDVNVLKGSANDIQWSKYDLIINALPLYIGPLLSAAFTDKQFLIDALYKDLEGASYFAEKSEVNYIPGTVWLEAQAREAFYFFTGYKADVGIDLEEIQSLKGKPYVFIGLSGSGKSTIGKEWARTENLQFVDLDEEIERTEHETIPDIFKYKGEKYFRELEFNRLKEYVHEKELLIASGGGIVTNPDSYNLLSAFFIPIWILSPLKVVEARLKNSSDDRPLIERSGNIYDILSSQAEKRIPLYAGLSEWVLLNSADDIGDALSLLNSEK